MKSILSKLFNRSFVAQQEEKGDYIPQMSSYVYGIGSPVWSGNDYHSYSQEGYIKNVIAYRCINIIAVAISSVPMVLYKKGENGIKEKLYNHPLLNLLYNPNPMLDRNSFLSTIISHQFISGNAYVLMLSPQNILSNNNECPKELYILRPDKTSVLVDKNSMLPNGYRYEIGHNKYKEYKFDKITGKSPILHFKNINPLDDWYGLSTVRVALNNIDQYNQSSSWIQALLQNAARPSGALIVKGDKGKESLTREQYDRLRNQINDFYMGGKNAGRPILLEGGLEWKEMSLSPKDMDLFNLKYSASRDIALAFGVPPQLLGIPGDNTYSNLVEARLSLWEQTIIPLLDNLLSKFNNHLVPYFGNDLELSYDKDNIDILMSYRGKHWDSVNNVDFLTVNEKRKMFNFHPLQEGDKLQ